MAFPDVGRRQPVLTEHSTPPPIAPDYPSRLGPVRLPSAPLVPLPRQADPYRLSRPSPVPDCPSHALPVPTSQPAPRSHPTSQPGSDYLTRFRASLSRQPTSVLPRPTTCRASSHPTDTASRPLIKPDKPVHATPVPTPRPRPTRPSVANRPHADFPARPGSSRLPSPPTAQAIPD